MHKELDPIPGMQPKMLADSFGDGGLALDGDGGFHFFSITSNKK
jgi:hypothetical protein